MPRMLPLLQVLVFALFLAGPVGLSLLGVPGGRLAVENRPMAKAPPLAMAWSDPAGFGPALAGYCRDAAPFRDHLIRANSRLRLALFRESPVPGVVLGRDGWLFYSLEWALDDFLNVIPLAEREIAAMVRIQVERRDWLAARGMGYLVVFAPDKAGVYPEFLPEGISPLGPMSRLDQLVPRLRQAGVAVVDLREALPAAKAAHRAYMKTDTHWNGWGALAGASAIVEAVRRQRPDLPALDPGAYEVAGQDRPGGDLAEMLLLPDIWREHDLLPRARGPVLARPAPDGPYPDPADHPERSRAALETGQGGWPRLVVFHDSFARGMMPYLAERFSRSVFLWSHAFSPEIIEAERPDVVVLEVVARYIFALSLENPEGMRPGAQQPPTGNVSGDEAANVAKSGTGGALPGQEAGRPGS